MFKLGLILGVCVGFAAAGNHARAQDLVIGGEHIADAKTVALARAEPKLVLYSTYVTESFAPVIEAFKADTGIRNVEYLRLTTQNMFPRVAAEYNAKKLAADIVLITDLPLVAELVAKNILSRPHRVPAFDRLPRELRGDDGRWYVALRQAMTIGVNTAIVKSAADQPLKWIDLLAPKWKGRISAPSIDAGGTAFLAFAFVREKIAPDYWPRLAMQKPRIFPGSAPVATDLVRGESSAAIIAASLLIPQIKAGAPVRMVFPQDGFPAYPLAGGITSTAPHPHLATLFMNWLTSKRGGMAVARTGAYGTHPDADTPTLDGIKFPAGVNAWNMSMERWQEERVRYSEQWRAIFEGK
jgi:iron(III) transport system substrate-binding protein